MSKGVTVITGAIWLCAAAFIAEAQTVAKDPSVTIQAGKALLKTALASGDLKKLGEARAQFAAAAADSGSAALAHYHVGYTEYLESHLVKDRAAAKSAIDRAVAALEQAQKSDKKLADAVALLASCYGEQIGHNPQLGMTLGPKSTMMLLDAQKLEPKNPRVVLLAGISAYYTPEMYGGSKAEGMKRFEEAAKLFESYRAPSELHPDWGRDEVHAWIGQAYLEQQKPAEAKRAFEAALKINPEYGWVKHDLLPRAEAMLKNPPAKTPESEPAPKAGG
ncbi:MAG: tetratricopeptide repeat protein [Planctomycetota bacterium]